MLKINQPRVVHETIDGETVLLDLNKGVYFSFDGLGVLLWHHVEANGTYVKLIESSEFTAEQKGLIEEFFRQLVEEEILVETDASASEESMQAFFAAYDTAADFKAPVINKYSDMQDLLLLDPIHEVEKEQGWPKPLNK